MKETTYRTIRNLRMFVFLLVNNDLKGGITPSHCDSGEQWYRYDSIKSSIHDSKAMLCIWWDDLGVMYSELRKTTEKITDNRTQRQTVKQFFYMAMLNPMLKDNTLTRDSTECHKSVTFIVCRQFLNLVNAIFYSKSICLYWM